MFDVHFRLRMPALAAGTGLLLLALLTRHYILAPETGDIDEATFAVVAQSVLRGYLPYEMALDNKPAGFFYLLAGIMAVFGESVATVRLFGTALVGATAVALLTLCRRYLPLPTAATLAALFVVANAGDIGNSTKSELVANLFVSLSLLVLVKAKGNWASLWSGLLISCAVLSRTNLAYLAAALAVVHLVATFRPGTLGFRREAILALGIGGLVPLSLLMLPYIARGDLHLLWLGAVEVALAHSQGRRDILGMIVLLPHSIVRVLPSLAGLLIVMGGIALWSLWTRRSALSADTRRDVLLALTYLAAIQLSVLMSGTFYNHYMLQLLPPIVLLVAVGLGDPTWRLGGPINQLAQVAVGLGAAWYGWLGMLVLADQVSGRLERPLQAAAQLVSNEIAPEDKVWAAGSTQLILFYLNRDPVVPVAAFPPNLARPSITAPLERAGRMPSGGASAVLEMRPRYVVNSAPGAPSQLSEVEGEMFLEHYDLLWSEGRIHLYRLRPDSL